MDNISLSISSPYTNSLFQQPWWLDAVAPGIWSEVTSVHDGKIVGRLPFVISNKNRITRINHPTLTQTLGPWIKTKDGKPGNILGWEKDIMNDLMSKLPKFDSFQQNFHYSISNWLPFYWNGFSQTTKYTYVIEELQDIDVVYSRFTDNIKSDIKKATKNCEVDCELSLSDFYEQNALIYKYKGLSQPFSLEFLSRIDKACGDNRRKIFTARDKESNILSTIFVIWDERSAYYLLGGSNPEFRSSGANSLLLWEAIKFASLVTKKFDFEGSMIEPIERYFRGFGALQKPFLNITKANLKYKTYTKLREKLKF